MYSLSSLLPFKPCCLCIDHTRVQRLAKMSLCVGVINAVMLFLSAKIICLQNGVNNFFLH